MTYEATLAAADDANKKSFVRPIFIRPIQVLSAAPFPAQEPLIDGATRVGIEPTTFLSRDDLFSNKLDFCQTKDK